MIRPNNYRPAAAAVPPPSKLSPHAPPFTGGRQARASAPPPPPPSAASYYYLSASAGVGNVVGGVLTGDDVELGLSSGPLIRPSDLPEIGGGKGGDSTLSLSKGDSTDGFKSYEDASCNYVNLGDSTDGFKSYEDASCRWYGNYENVVGGHRSDWEKHLKTYDKSIKSSNNILQSPAYGAGPLLEGFDGLNLAALSLPMNVHCNLKENTYYGYEASSCSYSEEPAVKYSSPVCPTSTEEANVSTKKMNILNFKNKLANKVPFQESQPAVNQIGDGKLASLQRNKDSHIMSYNVGDFNYALLMDGTEVTNPENGAEVISPQSRVADIRLSDSFPSRNHIDSFAEFESGLRSRPSVIPATFNPACVFKEYGDTKQTLSEAHDHIQAEDSPCWKGAPTSWQSPFADGQHSDYQVLQQDFNGCDGSGSVQNSLNGGKRIDLPCANTGIKEHRKFLANKHKSESIACSKNLEVKNGNLKQSVEEELGSNCQDLSAEISSQEKIIKNLCDTLSDSSSKTHPSNLSSPEVRKIGKLGLPDLPPKSPTTDENVGSLVKKIHDLSGILCTFYDTGELVEYDIHLLQSVMDILSTSIRRNGKASEKVLAHPGEKNIEALAYKNLWIQAEEALRMIKYEHQLTFLKLTREAQKCSAKENSKSFTCNCVRFTSPNLHRPSSTEVQLCNNPSTSVGQTDIVSQSAPYSNQASSSGALYADEIDASVMSRLRILKGRSEICNVVEQEKYTGHSDSYAKGKEALQSPFAGSEIGMGIKASSVDPCDIGSLKFKSQHLDDADVPGDRYMVPKGRRQKFGAICDVDSLHGSCGPEQATVEINACMPPIRSYYADMHGNRHFVEGSDAASSE